MRSGKDAGEDEGETNKLGVNDSDNVFDDAADDDRGSGRLHLVCRTSFLLSGAASEPAAALEADDE